MPPKTVYVCGFMFEPAHELVLLIKKMSEKFHETHKKCLDKANPFYGRKHSEETKAKDIRPKVISSQL